MNIRSLAIAAPAYNEAESIREIVLCWQKYLSNSRYIKDYEIVICNDGSTDNTEIILKELADEISNLHVINLKTNKGAGFALACAIQATEADWVALFDTDNQFPVQNIDAMIKHINTDTLAIIGARKKKHNSILSRIGSYLSSSLCNLIHGTKLRDFNSANKLISGSVLRSLTLEARGFNYSTEITSKLLEAGLKITEVNVDHNSRVKGNSKMKFIRDGIHRMLFVAYIAIRLRLIKSKVITTEKKSGNI